MALHVLIKEEHVDSLLDQFLREEASPYVRGLILDAVAEEEGGFICTEMNPPPF